MFTVTPLPWLPSCGLTTTGRPTSSATFQASSTSVTGRPSGTGTPAACSRRLVRSLSCAMDSATALVVSSSAAWIRRAFEPQPSCTSEPLVRRRTGMPRATAASTMAPVEGPMRSSSSSSRSWGITASASNGVSASAACTSLSACSMACRPTASSVYSTTTWYVPSSTVAWLRLKVTGQPASACSDSAAASSTSASDTGWPAPSGRSAPMRGKRARRRSSKPGSRLMSRSAASHCTMASTAVLRVQMLGPRRARIRVICMGCSFSKFHAKLASKAYLASACSYCF